MSLNELRNDKILAKREQVLKLSKCRTKTSDGKYGYRTFL